MPLGIFRLNTLSAAIQEALPPPVGRPAVFTAMNSAKLSTARVLDIQSSLILTQTTNDYVMSNQDFSLSGDFTIEFWYYPNTITGGSALCSIGLNNATGSCLTIMASGNQILVNQENQSISIAANDGITLNRWTFISVVRSGSSIYLYVNNNKQTTTATYSGTVGSTDGVYIGYTPRPTGDGTTVTPYYCSGYIENFRISSVARYSASQITTYPLKYMDDSNTKVLLNFDGAANSTTIEDSNYTIGIESISASGGTESTFVDSTTGYTYKVHSFTTVGDSTFTVSTGGYMDYLIVGGGGGGGGVSGAAGNAGGGGGGGRVVINYNKLIAAGSYNVTVGFGGAGGAATAGARGGTGGVSAFNGLVVQGGGNGGGSNNTGSNGSNTNITGGGGGSGSTNQAGGTSINSYSGGSGAGSATATSRAGGGGGGNSGAGLSGAPTVGGKGGVGTTLNFDGTSRMYGPGGGGGGTTPGQSGASTSGAGTGSGAVNAVGNDGTSYYGGGGGGARTTTTIGRVGGTGGPGIVIIRYRIA